MLATIWKGVDMASMDEHSRTEFIRAVMDGNLEYAETLAECAKTDVTASDKEERTALHLGLCKRAARASQYVSLSAGWSIVVRKTVPSHSRIVPHGYQTFRSREVNIVLESPYIYFAATGALKQLVQDVLHRECEVIGLLRYLYRWQWFPR